jgi:murein DD-endopeptidase MepM/ murein hydrolase activator NlpD
MKRFLLFGAVVLALTAASAAFVVWRFTVQRPKLQEKLAPIPVAPAPQPLPAGRPSTIIDLPGDPALIRRPASKAPRSLALSVPVALAADAPRPETEAFYVREPLTPASGGYLGKFASNGQQADALKAELAMNATSPDAGGEAADDDGGDMTPDTPFVPLTSANSQGLDATPGGDNGRAQLKEAILRPKIAQKISELLVESGYEQTSADSVETAAKRLFNTQSLRAGAVALAIGAVVPSGDYRVTQLAMFQDGEYVGTVALAETGLYGEGAEPAIPPGFLDDPNRPPMGARFNLADGIYSAGLRAGAPEPAIREAVHLLARLVDLNAPLGTGETLRLLYARNPRAKGQPASQVIYAGVSGPAANANCYAFVLGDGSYRCFSAEEDTEQAPLPPQRPGEAGAPLPPERPGAGRPADSGASAVGGLLAPIRGAPITSLFGMRFHPILHITRLHAGIDFGAAVGSQVRAAADGVVESSGEAHGYGQRVVLKHGGYETTYNHLSEIRVDNGAKVRQGEIIALSGNSGLSTGPHLHFEYRIDGDPVDPMPHMGREVQGRVPVASSTGPSGPTLAFPPTPSRPPPPDPAILATFAAAKVEIDAVLAQAER